MLTDKPYGVLDHEEFNKSARHDRHKEEFEFTASFAGGIKNKDILQIGFGRGDHILLFLQEGARSYCGIDFSSTSSAIARKQFFDPRVRLELCEAKDLNDNQAFDVVVMYDAIQYIPPFDMEVIWRKLRKILRPGGFIVISTPIFDSPNRGDHSDSTFSQMGVQCHKQTVGTLMRTCLHDGIILAERRGQFFAFVRRHDLDKFPEPLRTEFVNNHNRILCSYGIDASKDEQLAEEENHLLVPGAGRVLIGCVAENTPKYLSQALRLVQSIRWFGGSLSGANTMICIVDQADQEYVEELKRWGVFVRTVPRFTYFHPQPNKLRFLEMPEIYTYDTVILMDCDTLVVQDPYPYINGKTLQAKIADGATVSLKVFRELFSFYGLPLPEPKYRTTFTDQSTIWYCNTGVLIFPQRVLKLLYPTWRKYTGEVVQNIDFLEKLRIFCEQASLTLAYSENPVPYEELPVAMNFPLHKTGPTKPVNMVECDPVIIHYHHLTDLSGFIKNTVYPKAQRRITEFNEFLAQSRRVSFNNRLFWDFRYAEHPDPVSGSGSGESSLAYKKQVLKRMVDELGAKSILDIGCGDQFVTKDLPDNLYTGIDLSPVIIKQNRRMYPKRNYIIGDLLSEPLPQFDLTICLDVTIHLGNVECYRTFVDRVITCTKDCGIISGYEGPPASRSSITFYHEPLSLTLKKGGARNLKKLGEYGDTFIWYFDKSGNTEESDISAVTQANDWWSACGETFKPYFLVGCMRSGTTLLAELLGRHREIVYAPFELRETWSKVGGVPMASPKTRDSVCPHLGACDVRPGQSLRLTQAFYDVYQKNLGNKNKNAIFLNKNPHLCNKLFFVNELFKESKFIWIYRDLPDVVASLKNLFVNVYKKREVWHYWPEKDGAEIRCWGCFFGGSLSENVDPARCFPGGDIRLLAEYWLENNMAVSDFFKSLSSGQTLAVKEEEVVSNTETAVAKCLAFMEVPLDTANLEGYLIDNQRNGKWKEVLTEADQRALLTFVEDHEQVIDQTFPEDNLSQYCQIQIMQSCVKSSYPKTGLLEDKDSQIRTFEEMIKTNETYINNLSLKLKEKEIRIQSLETSLANRSTTLNYIYHSYGLGALWVCNKMVDKLFPLNSRRRFIARFILKSMMYPKTGDKNLE